MDDVRPDLGALERALASLHSFRIEVSELEPLEDAKILGSGAYGTVRLAKLKRDGGKLVAVKEIRFLGGDVDAAVRLVREVMVLARMDHPNIVPLTGFHLGLDMDNAWIVYPYQANGNMWEYIARTQPDMVTRLKLVLDTANGLAYLHGRYPPVIHGDLIPSNVLIGHDARAMLSGFALARALDDIPSDLTTYMGTRERLRYSSPELALQVGTRRTIRSDMWAWGCLAAATLTGLIPFHNGNHPIGVLLPIARGEKPFFLDNVPIPPAVQNIICKCWETLPEDRPDIQYCIDILISCTRDCEAMDDDDTSSLISRSPLKIDRMHGDDPNAPRLLGPSLDLSINLRDIEFQTNQLYRATNVPANQPIAIKFFCKANTGGQTDDPKTHEPLLSRVVDMLTSWQPLRHERIQAFVGYAIVEGKLSLVSPWNPEGNLRGFIERNPDADRLLLLIQVAEGLIYLHSRTPVVIHSSIKMENVLMHSKAPVLCEVGLARFIEEQHLGTLSYGDTSDIRRVAPERLSGGAFTPKSDVYSFACLALETITGRQPFADEPNDAAVALAIHQGCSLLPGDYLKSQGYPELQKLLAKCCACDPALRPTMEEVYSQLLKLRNADQ